MSPDFEHKVLALLQQLPAGRVCSYGRLAALAGYPRHARHVGSLLGRLSAEQNVPWFRVVNSTGRIARSGTEQADWQRVLLEQEGIEFKDNGRIDLWQYGWPDEPA